MSLPGRVVKSASKWQDILKVLPKLKAKQAVKVEFSIATLKLAKDVPFTFKRLLQRYLKNEELTGFTVFLARKRLTGQQRLVREEDEAIAAHGRGSRAGRVSAVYVSWD